MRDMQVLVVEDNIDIGNLYNRLLIGHAVTTSTSGVTATEQLEKQRFDLIILDMHIGKVSGLDVLRAARRSSTQRFTRILVVSADDSLRPAARDIGIDCWMTKPIDIDRMYDYLQKISTDSVSLT